MHSHDVVIVGAGAAGIGAGLELAGTDLSFVVLEAADRVGGRALTDASTLPVAWDHGCHWLHSADINPLVAWADRLGAVYRTEDRVDHFAIWQAGRFVSAAELAGARAAPLAAFDAIEAAAEAENDVSIQEILPDAGRWNAGVRCVLQTMAGANPEEVSAPDYVDGEDTDLNWPVISGYGDLFARMASNLPIKLNVPVEKVLQRAGSVTLDTSAGTISAKAAIITASTSVLASGSIGFSPGPASELLDIIGDLPCGKYEKVALAVTDLPPETAGKIFCMIDPGSGARAIDFQIMSTSPPVLIAHLAGDAAGPAIDEGGPAMIALATERLVQAFGNDFRRGIIASGTSDWSHNPLILGSYSNARPGAAGQRRRAISMETDNIVFAGEAFSPHWTGAAHGAYESGREQARRLALRMKREVG